MLGSLLPDVAVTGLTGALAADLPDESAVAALGSASANKHNSIASRCWCLNVMGMASPKFLF
jgi:hypothetical protein